MQRRYNLATPELIETLRNADVKLIQRDYGIRFKEKHLPNINKHLTGSAPTPVNKKGWYAIYSKDIWNALRDSEERRNSYGHNRHAKVKKHCGHPINSFTFSDGSVIRKCAIEVCTYYDVQRQAVLCAPMGVR